MIVDLTGEGIAADERIVLTVDGYDATYAVA